MEVVFTNGKDKRFIQLCNELDDYLNSVVGKEKQQKQYDKYNVLSDINDVVLLIECGNAISCGSFKEYNAETAEIKRVFVSEVNREKGLGKKVMGILENRAREKGYKKLILETSTSLNKAQNMYRKLGFEYIENYGQYKNMISSVCMEKLLS